MIQIIIVLFLGLGIVLNKAQTCEQTVVSGTVDCTNYAVGRGKLALSGIQLVDEFNNVVQLRGVSSHGLQYNPECVTKSAIEFLVTNWGINVYRAAVFVDEWRNGYSVNAAYFDEYIQNVVQWCKELGIYVIIDWHIIGDPSAYLDSYYHGTHGLAVDFFGNYSLMYKDETHVIYEIANKPFNVNWDNLVWYHNLIIDTIRTHDPDAIIIAGTPGYSTEIDKAFADPVTNPHNVFYAFHFYAAQDAGLIPLFEEYIDKMPLFVSHWTISDDTDDGPYNVSVAEIYLELCSGKNDATPPPTVVSWVQWSFSDRDETASLLIPNSCSVERWWQTSCPGKFTENYLKDRLYHYPGAALECDIAPTPSPTVSAVPTVGPSSSMPSSVPSTVPTTAGPSMAPAVVPSSHPTLAPSLSYSPTSSSPTFSPSPFPTGQPTAAPSTPEPTRSAVVTTLGDSGNNGIPPAGIFFIVVAALGSALTAFYFYDARKKKLQNEALHQNAYVPTTQQGGKYEMSSPSPKGQKGDMDLGNIYDNNGEGDEFSATHQDSVADLSKNVDGMDEYENTAVLRPPSPPPSPPQTSPHGSPKSSSSTALLSTRQPVRRTSSRSPPRRTRTLSSRTRSNR